MEAEKKTMDKEAEALEELPLEVGAVDEGKKVEKGWRVKQKTPYHQATNTVDCHRTFERPKIGAQGRASHSRFSMRIRSQQGVVRK